MADGRRASREELCCGGLTPDCRKLGKAVAEIARAKQWAAAIALLQDAWAGSAQVDVVTLGAAVSACRVTFGWRWGSEILAMGLRRGFGGMSAVLRGTAMGAVRVGGTWTSALTLVAGLKDQSVRANAVHLSTAAAAASEVLGSWGVAVALLQAERGIVLDPPAVSSLVASLSRGEKWQGALNVFLRHTETLTVRLANAALTAMEAGELWPAASALLGDLRQARLRADVRGVNSAASAAAQGVGWRWSLHLLERSRHDAAGRDVVGTNVALAALGQGRHWGSSLSLLRAFCDLRLAPDVTSFGTVTSSCKRAGRVALAQELLTEAGRRGFVLSATIYGAVLAGCTWATAFALLHAARGALVQTDAALANAAASACEPFGAWQMATRLLHFLGPEANTRTIGAATASCVAAGAWLTGLRLLSAGSWRALPAGPVARAAAAAAAWQAGRWRQVVALLTHCGRAEKHRLDIPGAVLAASCLEAQSSTFTLPRLLREVAVSADKLILYLLGRLEL
ncbi:EMB2654 [Symbiodinium natans]|uniref:EMB2654 protein n=1 Tax=Symbiodinium natans TaxID=878477 RepID=A0A812IN55_9DINO|nr:EMB2654 [Symbiodinium natans]